MSDSTYGHHRSRKRTHHRRDASEYEDLKEKLRRLEKEVRRSKRRRSNHRQKRGRSSSSSTSRGYSSREYQRSEYRKDGERYPRGTTRHRYSSSRSSSVISSRHDGDLSSEDTAHPRLKNDHDKNENSRAVPSLSGKTSSKNTPEVNSGNNLPGDADATNRSLPAENTSEVQELSLSEDVLTLLGEVPSNEQVWGPEIHTQIAERWSKILQEGLTKEARDEFLKKYPPPKNCQLMRAPAINAEIKSVLSPTALKKDYFQSATQVQLAAALSALGTGLMWALTAKEACEKPVVDVNYTQLISALNDASWIMAGLHHQISLSRRAMMIPSLNPLVKKVVEETKKIDGSLFGAEFSNALKAAEAIEKSSKTISKGASSQPKPRAYSGGSSSYQSQQKKPSSTSHLNSKGPSRKTSYSRNSHSGGQRKSSRYQRR